MSSVGAEVPGGSSGARAEVASKPFGLKAAWHIRPVRWIVYCGLLITAAIAGAAGSAWVKGAAEMTGMAMLVLFVMGGMILLCARQVGNHLSRQGFKLDTALNHMS